MSQPDTTTARAAMFVSPRCQVQSSKCCSSVPLELLNYSVHKITVWPITGHHAPSSSWWILDCMTEEFVYKARHLAGVCLKRETDSFKQQFQLIDKMWNFLGGPACQRDNYSSSVCMSVCACVGLEPASLLMDTIWTNIIVFYPQNMTFSCREKKSLLASLPSV